MQSIVQEISAEAGLSLILMFTDVLKSIYFYQYFGAEGVNGSLFVSN